MLIREATVEDSSKLQSLQEQCTTGENIMITTVNEPDFFARVKAYEHYKVFVLISDGDILGSIACALRKVTVSGKIVNSGYIFQMFVSPRQRQKGIGSKLYEHAEKYMIKNNVDISYFVVMNDNIACMKLYENHGYKLKSNQIMPYLPVYKNMHNLNRNKYKVRYATMADVEEIVEMLNDNWSNYDLYEYLTKEKLIKEIERIPEFDFNNILILEESEKLVAFIGFWDWSKVTRITVKAINIKLRILGTIMKFVNIYYKSPRMPKKGELLKQLCLTHFAFKRPEDFSEILKYINNIALDLGIEQICFTFDKDNILSKSLKEFFHINIPYSVYSKTFKYDINDNVSTIIRGIDL